MKNEPYIYLPLRLEMEFTAGQSSPQTHRMTTNKEIKWLAYFQNLIRPRINKALKII